MMTMSSLSDRLWISGVWEPTYLNQTGFSMIDPFQYVRQSVCWFAKYTEFYAVDDLVHVRNYYNERVFPFFELADVLLAAETNGRP